MKGIWVRAVRHNRTVKQDTGECSFEDAKDFDRLEIEYMEDAGRHSDDPRNA